MKVWVVRGIHPHVPGEVIDVYATREAADIAACELVNIMLKDEGDGKVATPQNWRRNVAALNRRTDGDGDVWVRSYPVKGATP